LLDRLLPHLDVEPAAPVVTADLDDELAALTTPAAVR
jgi:hypothetical protein